MQEVKDFPDEITGKTYSPIRENGHRRKTNLFSTLVDYGKRRLSMVTGGPKSPDLEGKKAISHKDFLPPTPEDDNKRRRSSITSLFSKKSNSPVALSPATAKLTYMENGGPIEEEKSRSESEHDNDPTDLYLPHGDDNIAEGEGYGFGDNVSDCGKASYPQPDKEDNLSKKDFQTHIKQLDRRRKWAENEIRRASDSFLSNYDKTGKAAMDRFIVRMSRGVIVRRHQAGCAAEEVRLFSDNGCHTIMWESPKVMKRNIHLFSLSKQM